MKYKHLWLMMSCLVAASGACGDDATAGPDVDAVTPDTEVGAGDSDVSISQECPPLAVFAGVTCVASQENAVCPGTTFCDACGANVDTTCTCVASGSGRAFQCADPCATCSATPDASETADTSEPEVTREWVSAGACTLVIQGFKICSEHPADGIGPEMESDCTAENGFGEPGVWTVSCSTDGAIGYCQYVDERIVSYGSASDVSLHQSNCVSEGGTWTTL